MLTIYHNPRCSKSREALAWMQAYAQEHGRRLEVIEYLKDPPDRRRLQELQAALGCGMSDMVRSSEEAYRALGLQHADDAALLDALATHPELLQRPIVVTGDRALIARPPTLLEDFFGWR
ncbi:MAG TPA: arsenate reductase (glutaredoxin) [Noviherbaspirillum sp.]|nr:arsenate reductase (glutaredoxin) [Noviherbaspirillum sp.]